METAPFEEEGVPGDVKSADEQKIAPLKEVAADLGASVDKGDNENDRESGDRPLLDLEEVEAMIPEKTKALMDELFRAKLEKVKRIDSKKIR